MITELHNVYVSRELALLLKEAGFDWECKTYYDISLYRDEIIIEGEFHDYNFTTGNIIFSAPTLDVAQRWLREEKNYEIFVVVKFLADKEYIARVETNISGYSTDIYKFYEEAQEAGIKKALELILEKGE